MAIAAAAALGLVMATNAPAKGGEDKPILATLDEEGNTVKIDPANNDVDVDSLPAVKIDATQNDVDANVA